MRFSLTADQLAFRDAVRDLLAAQCPPAAVRSRMAVPDPRQPSSEDEELLGAEVPTVASLVTDEQRVERMRAELAMGFEALRGTKLGVSVFGSARTVPGHPVYEQARALGRGLAEAGFTVITGGGPAPWRAPTAARTRRADARSA